MSKICDECETVAHCTKHGCVPKQQALDKMAENARELGLDYEPVWNNLPSNKDVEDAMRLKRLTRLAEQPAQGCEYCNNALYAGTKCKNCGRVTEPAQRKPLTDEEIIKCWGQVSGTRYGYVAFARAIEAAHGIKENT